jgi:hypothetical protein
MLAQAAHAGGNASDTDHITPAGATATITNSGNLTFVVTTNLGTFTASCTSVVATVKTPTAGFTDTIHKISFGALIPQADTQPIDITGCTDSAGGTDTVTSSGAWRATFFDKINDETTVEPNLTGDKFSVLVPVNGATLSSSLFPACVLTLDPTTSSAITVTYNDKGTGTIPQGEVPGSVGASGAGCPITSVSETLNTSKLISSVKFADKS